MIECTVSIAGFPSNFFRDDEIGGVFGVKDEENNIRT